MVLVAVKAVTAVKALDGVYLCVFVFVCVCRVALVRSHVFVLCYVSVMPCRVLIL